MAVAPSIESTTTSSPGSMLSERVRADHVSPESLTRATGRCHAVERVGRSADLGGGPHDLGGLAGEAALHPRAHDREQGDRDEGRDDRLDERAAPKAAAIEAPTAPPASMRKVKSTVTASMATRTSATPSQTIHACSSPTAAPCLPRVGASAADVPCVTPVTTPIVPQFPRAACPGAGLDRITLDGRVRLALGPSSAARAARARAAARTSR